MTPAYALLLLILARTLTKPSIRRWKPEPWCKVRFTYSCRLICFAIRRRLPWQQPQQRQPDWFILPDAAAPIYQILSADRRRSRPFRPVSVRPGFCQHRHSLLWRCHIRRPCCQRNPSGYNTSRHSSECSEMGKLRFLSTANYQFQLDSHTCLQPWLHVK